MSEVPIIAGVEAWPFEEMDRGNLSWEAHKRLREGEKIFEGMLFLVMGTANDCMFFGNNTEDTWRRFVQWLRDRDAG